MTNEANSCVVSMSQLTTMSPGLVYINMVDAAGIKRSCLCKWLVLVWELSSLLRLRKTIHRTLSIRGNARIKEDNY